MRDSNLSKTFHLDISKAVSYTHLDVYKRQSGNEIKMPDQKIDNLLNLAMDATPQERRKSGNLNIGYDLSLIHI